MHSRAGGAVTLPPHGAKAQILCRNSRVNGALVQTVSSHTVCLLLFPLNKAETTEAVVALYAHKIIA